MEISAKVVNELRHKTGAGMMDCKKALVETGGDFDKAIEVLRKKGQKVAESRVGRDANEGSIIVKSSADNTAAAIIEINCETDFVARNADFQTLGNEIAALAEANRPANLEALKALAMGDGRTVSEHLTDIIGKIGEKIDVREYALLTGDSVVTYIHPGARVGVVVAFSGAEGDVAAAGRDVAMQITAMKPIAIDKDGVSTDIVQKEIEIGMDLARQEGKPETMLEKIAQGKLQKFYKENTLLNQEFVKDGSKTIAQYIKENLGASATVVGFHRFELGA
ncbi:MAG: translation elongation factor Ts [Bacteroidia bacterium]